MQIYLKVLLQNDWMSCELDKNREEIQEIDKKIFQLLKMRFKRTDAIGKIKQKTGLKVENKQREQQLIEDAIKNCKLDKKIITKIYNDIFYFSKKQQKWITL